MVLRVEGLDVYRIAEELADAVWETCIEWDYFAQNTIGKQFVRAADSISSNLAEGHGKFHFKDRLNFCYYARGSLEETKNWLSKAERRGLIGTRNHLRTLLESLPKKLNAYIASIKKAQERQS